MLKAFGADINIRGELGRNIVIKSGNNLTGQNILIPGDISSAAFWMIAASIVPESEIVIKNVGLNPTRTGILNVMDEMGDDTVLHILSICIFLTIGPFSLAFDCAIDFPSMAENEWGVRRRPQIT